MSSAGDVAGADHPDADAVCVVGLGYVGLPLAVAFDRAGRRVVGFDVDADKVARLGDGVDPTGEVGDEAVADGDVEFTADPAPIADVDYAIITVPTPVGDSGEPNMEFVEAAGETVGEHIAPGTTVVLESTVYPGATREVLAPAVERASGLTAGEEFEVGYSPERLAPGTDRTVSEVVKVVGADDDDVRQQLVDLYESVVDAGVHPAPDLETAEASKVIENVQRDVNIALINELAMAFDELGIDTREVLEAASTKWSFHGDYRPGLVGGHCIPVDPNLFAHRAEQAGYTPDLIRQARETNEEMPRHAARLALKALADRDEPIGDARLLVLGLAFKPNVGDIRNSLVGTTIDELESFGVEVVAHDPYADDEAMREQFGVEVRSERSFHDVDGVLLAADHDAYDDLDLAALRERLDDDAVLVDLEGRYDAAAAEDYGFHYSDL